jgi:hypothetical protein
MPDWHALVSERLGTLAITPERREEVVAEFAGHLEDSYPRFPAEGRSESEAIKSALGEVPDWKLLARRVSLPKRGEDHVNIQTKYFWLPGLLSLTASVGWLEILQLVDLETRIPWPYPVRPNWSYLLWLITLPFFGAMAAYLSRHVGGGRGIRLAAGLFPCTAMFGLMCFRALQIIYFEKNGLVIRHPARFFCDDFVSLGRFPRNGLAARHAAIFESAEETRSLGV